MGRPRVGIVGAGQLARMTYQAAIPLGLSPRLLAASPDDGAAIVAHEVELGAATSAQALTRLATQCDVVTFDHELVNAEAVAQLELAGHRFWPTAATLRLVQDKLFQRQALARIGCPGPAFVAVESDRQLFDFAAQHGWPLVAKARRGGYDGRGVWVLDGPPAAIGLLEQCAASGTTLLVEAFVEIEREAAILVARRPSGSLVVYPVVETVQRDGICVELLAPPLLPSGLAGRAAELARQIAIGLDVVGILAVELFVSSGRLLVNELAARPHNSGHYTIEACATSQFENHLRAILDWPLGETSMRAPAAATVNLLGGPRTPDLHTALPDALAVPGAHVHLYGKTSRPGRKIGHVTVLGDEVTDALSRARQAAALIVEPLRKDEQ